MQKHELTTGFVKPLDKCLIRCDTGLRTIRGGMYGWTRNGGSKFHGGIDLYAEPGTDCYAIYSGHVEWAGETNTGWGHAVLARVEFPQWVCWTLYAHLSKINVKRGQKLTSRCLIGKTGTSGNADSKYPHLHFEAWRSLEAGKKRTYDKFRFDPLYLLGHISYVPFAVDVIEASERRSRTA
jgi:murein DD-endopeptidase MepM/ murein hydrolase activator NlpD